MPAAYRRLTNGLALPSNAGNSLASSSTSRLSTPRACVAASRCSTVCTRQPFSPRVVAYWLSASDSGWTATVVLPRCIRRKRIPASGAAGRGTRRPAFLEALADDPGGEARRNAEIDLGPGKKPSFGVMEVEQLIDPVHQKG